MTEDSTEVELLDDIPGVFRQAVYCNVLISIWHTTATLALLDRVFLAMQRLAKGAPRGFSAIHVVAGQTRMPPKEVRDRMVAIGGRFNSQAIASAIVIGQTGFAASTARSLVTNISLLIRPRLSTAAHRTIVEAAEWLAERHAARGIPLDPVELNLVAQRVYELPGAELGASSAMMAADG